MWIIVIVQTIVLGKWYAWYGGYCWGYRMAGEIIPYLVLLLGPFLQSEYYEKARYKYLFFVLIFVSIFMQVLGLLYFDGVWHTVFDGKPGWLWSVENSQWLFSIKRGLGKVGIYKFDISNYI